MSSFNRCIHSNSSRSGQCPSNSLQDLSSIASDEMESRRSFVERQRLGARAVQLANRFDQLQVNSDLNTLATRRGAATDRSHHHHHRYSRQSESLAEEELIERMKEVINEFMTRPGRQHSYNTSMRWTVDHGNEINYSVVVLINQPSNLV